MTVSVRSYKKIIILWVLLLSLPVGCQQSIFTGKRGAAMKSVAFTEVKITDKFWAPRIENNRTITIPGLFKMCEDKGRIDNFAIAGGLKQGEHKGDYPFDDTDVYKIVEAASFSLAVHPDAELEKYIDRIIEYIAAAQEDDGYLFTPRTNKYQKLMSRIGEQRWVNETTSGNSHELYNMGHLYEAAVAHYYATGKKNLLDVAIKNADLACQVFGPGKNTAYPGHQVIEMGLVKMYQATGEEKYLKLAKFFLDTRGPGGEEYKQSHKKVLEQDQAVGHAVRAAYMYSGMADVAAATGDKSYIKAIDGLWENVVGKKMYLTGGIGSEPSIEGFGPDYDLPNMSAYCETCASIANIFWNQRLFLLCADAKYIDVLERTLYNGFLSGVSMDGKLFFYPNPLASRGQHIRTEWFSCACCPPNVARLIASLPGYVYAQNGKKLYVNLFIAGSTSLKIGSKNVSIEQKTNYPWDGEIKINVNPDTPANFELNIRIPGWSQNKPIPSDLYHYLDTSSEKVALKVNGRPIDIDLQNGYALIKRKWQKGDIVELSLPMPVRRIGANPKVTENKGKAAIQRGPLVYCIEWPDVDGGNVLNLLVPDDSHLEIPEGKKYFCEGVIASKGLAFRIDDNGTLIKDEKDFLAIPYFAWAHRGRGEMAVWLAREESAVEPAGGPTITEKSTITASVPNANIKAVNDGIEPVDSSDRTKPFLSFYPKKGETEWLQLDFGKVYEPSIVEVYWVGEGPDGEHRLPKAWKIKYKLGNEWKDCWSADGFKIEKDRYNKVIFETVRTDAIRLEVEMQDGFTAGLYELRIK